MSRRKAERFARRGAIVLSKVTEDRLVHRIA